MSKLVFDPRDPFPLLSRELGATFDYESEKAHAETVDTWLGLRTDLIEKSIRDRVRETPSLPGTRATEIWLGKSVQTVSTPYTERERFINRLCQ